MKQTVNFSTFQMAFEAIRPENFSYEGLSVLFDYLTQLEESIGEEMELDVIAICCDYSEEHWKDIAENYSLVHVINDPGLDDDDKAEAVTLWLEDHTLVAGKLSDGSIVYCSAF